VGKACAQSMGTPCSFSMAAMTPDAVAPQRARPCAMGERRCRPDGVKRRRQAARRLEEALGKDGGALDFIG
jgi:hypothetical protein